jgi:large-conductance mechanosensitive channel
MATDPEVGALQRRTAAAGVALLVLAFGTGVLLAAAMTKTVDADVHEIVAAHLNAVLGALWLIALALTLPMLSYGPVGRVLLVLGTALPAYANWLVTAVKAFFHVTGVALDGNRANDAVFATLGVFVVLPSFGAAIAWLVGLVRTRR